MSELHLPENDDYIPPLIPFKLIEKSKKPNKEFRVVFIYQNKVHDLYFNKKPGIKDYDKYFIQLLHAQSKNKK